MLFDDDDDDKENLVQDEEEEEESDVEGLEESRHFGGIDVSNQRPVEKFLSGRQPELEPSTFRNPKPAKSILSRKRRKKTNSARFMSASEAPIVPQPSAAPQVGLNLLRPSSLDLDGSEVYQHKMGYHTGLIVGGGCCPPGIGAGAHLARQDVMTYSQYVHGSIFSVPKSWQLDHGENLVVSVYTFLKTFLG